MTKTKQELFEAEVTKAIQTAIARLEPGTAGISVDCLWQHTRIERTPNAPMGTNAAWVARRVFDGIVKRNPWGKFIYHS